MSIRSKKKTSAGVYLLPLVIAVPLSAAAVFAFYRIWPFLHKMASILIKLVVKA